MSSPAEAAGAASWAHGLRIAVVGPTFPYKGGIAQHTTETAHRLLAAGHQVALVSWAQQYPDRLYPGRQRVDEPESPPFARTTYPLSWRRPDGWWRTGRRLGRQADLVVVVLVSPVQVPALLVLVRAARRGARVLVLVLCHNVLPHERRRVDGPLVRRLLAGADGVLVHSEDEADRARGLAPDVPVRVASLPPRLPTGLPVQPWPAPDRPSGGKLLFFGLIRPYKGVDLLVRALGLSRADWRLEVHGEFWSGEQEIRDLVDDLGLGDRVQLHPGYVADDELAALLPRFDALVLPYRSSTSSSNAQLAFAAGLPVVAARVGTMAQAVTDGVDGLLCPPSDESALARALDRLADPGELVRLRGGVRPPDLDTPWERYCRALVGGTA